MRPRATARRGLPVVLLALLAGCFQDKGSNSSGSATGGECMPGEIGCACLDGGGCGEGLECVDDLCVPIDCVQGSLNCGCFMDTCFNPLVCMDGLCQPGGQGTSDTGDDCFDAECDGDLCTIGDLQCGENCATGLLIDCPPLSVCQPQSGVCECEPGWAACQDGCIPQGQCCDHADCSRGEVCNADGQCACIGENREPGLSCAGQCLIGVDCCPGETTTDTCTCGATRSCDNSGFWGECSGGNPNPMCDTGDERPCGNCGLQQCQADCSWGLCQGEGMCMPNEIECIDGAELKCGMDCNWGPGCIDCC